MSKEAGLNYKLCRQTVCLNFSTRVKAVLHQVSLLALSGFPTEQR